MSVVAAHGVSTSSERVLMPLSAHPMLARWSNSTDHPRSPRSRLE
jgi:hypothetical protein